MTTLRLRIFPVIFATTVLPAASASADAIDGEWCSTDGRHFSIQGPKITTERGAHVVGDYQRHAFSYVVPEPDRDAGRNIDMILADPVTVRVRQRESPNAPIETWKRCDVTS